MAGHKPNEKMKKMNGGRIYANKGLYARKTMKGGGNGKMPRYGLFNGGSIVKSSMPIATKS